MKNNLKMVILPLLVVLTAQVYGQNSRQTGVNVLVQYGIAEPFLGGLFRGVFPVSDIRKNGDFGIAAPDMVDGEVIMYKGKVYQTRSNGETTPVADSVKVPLAFVCYFRPDTSFRISGSVSQKEAEAIIESHLPNKNGIYAVRISGLFTDIKTRTFYPVSQEPFPPIATLISQQKIFDMKQQKGTMFGFRMPSYMASVNIQGYHFHFISDDFKKGGHMVDFAPGDVLVEIALVSRVDIHVPVSRAFTEYQPKPAAQK